MYTAKTTAKKPPVSSFKHIARRAARVMKIKLGGIGRESREGVLTARRRLEEIVEATNQRNTFKVKQIHSPRIIGVGGGQVVINIGKFNINGKIVPCVAKFFKSREQNNYLALSTNASKAEHIEKIAAYVKSKGIPIVFHTAVPFRGSKVIVSENLAAEGKRVLEVQNFDYGKVKNADEIKGKLRKYSAILNGLIEEDVFMLERHNKPIGYKEHEGVEHCFFIVVNPKTGKGEVVAGDFEHFKYGTKGWADIEGIHDVIP
jgi:hypothetical protein